MSTNYAKQFAEACKAHANCATPPMFIDRDSKHFVSNDSFNRQYNHLINGAIEGGSSKFKRYRDNAARAAIASPALCQVVKATCYEPGGPEINAKGEYNMWRDPGIEPLADAPKIFLEHVAHMFNEHERELVLDWLAWVVQHPERKIMFGLLIVGRGGTGKSWFNYLMERLLGDSNVAIFLRQEVAENKFNAEKQFRRLWCYDEIKSGKSDLAAALASDITERRIRIELKGHDAVFIPNTANVLAVSNFINGLNMKGEHTRRRWLVVQANADKPHSSRGQNTQRTEYYYARLWSALPRDGSVTDDVRRVLWYLQQRDLSGFNPNSAPETESKEEVVEATSTECADTLAAMWRKRSGPFRHELFTMAEVMRDATVGVRVEDRKRVQAEVAHILIELGGRRVDRRQREVKGEKIRYWTDVDNLEKYRAMTSDQLRADFDEQRADPLFDDLAMFGGNVDAVAYPYPHPERYKDSDQMSLV